MYTTILVPTDGSDAATHAGELALSLASDADAAVHAVYILDLRDVPRTVETAATEHLRSIGDEAIDAIATLAADHAVEFTGEVHVATGPIHRSIIEYADTHGVDLIVMGTRGRAVLDRFAIGSVAKHTLRRAPMPVLTVQADAAVPSSIDAVLVPTDGSAGADAAAAHANELCAASGATLHAVNVVDVAAGWGNPELSLMLDTLEEVGQRAVDAVVDRADEAGLGAVESSVLTGTPARAICDYASQHGIDVIVIGTHGRTGIDRLVLGSVAERVIRLADAPVLAVKERAP